MATRRQSSTRLAYDGGTDDPRMLVYWYQQKVRAQLLERQRRHWWADYAEPVGRIVRMLLTPNPDRSTPAPQTKITHAMF